VDVCIRWAYSLIYIYSDGGVRSSALGSNGCLYEENITRNEAMPTPMRVSGAER